MSRIFQKWLNFVVLCHLDNAQQAQWGFHKDNKADSLSSWDLGSRLLKPKAEFCLKMTLTDFMSGFLGTDSTEKSLPVSAS